MDTIFLSLFRRACSESLSWTKHGWHRVTVDSGARKWRFVGEARYRRWGHMNGGPPGSGVEAWPWWAGGIHRQSETACEQQAENRPPRHSGKRVHLPLEFADWSGQTASCTLARAKCLLEAVIWLKIKRTFIVAVTPLNRDCWPVALGDQAERCEGRVCVCSPRYSQGQDNTWHIVGG